MIDGFGIRGFRSFGANTQYLHPLQKVNLIAGRNNVGKSNILRAIQLYSKSLSGEPFSLGLLDEHQGKNKTHLTWKLPISPKEFKEKLLNSMLGKESPEYLKALLLAIVDQLPFYENEKIWIEKRNILDPISAPDAQTIRLALIRTGNFPDVNEDWRALWERVTRQRGGSFEAHWGPEVIQKILGLMQWKCPKVHLLDAHRKIGAPGSSYKDLNGEGLISKLSELQRPELKNRTDSLEKFAKITDFFTDVLEASDVQIEVSHSEKELNIKIGEKILPIESLGTGVHELLIFATAATIIEDEIICIEEPEIHLHPRLQKKLLNYLTQKTTNQYFITTHSAALLDAPGVAIFHATQNSAGETELEQLTSDKNRAAIGFDLGYKASDLVQSNAIIWVEGPSDRIYIRSWLNANSDYIEGLHYTIMFYGGRLLSHLSAGDDTITDFIALQKINRNMAILIDSDKRSTDDKINATKQRVLNEIEENGGYGWVTAGREIENYISKYTMEAARKKAHPTIEFSSPTNQWGCAYKAKGSRIFHADKIAIAREATKDHDYNILDLNSKIAQLIEFIKKSNQ